MENFAERLFCDLKNAGFKIELPLYVVDGVKLGQFKDAQQLNILGMRGKYIFNKGISFQTYDIEFKLTFTEAYVGFLNSVKSIGTNLKFYSLVIPKRGVVDVMSLEYETVIGRYIKNYLPNIDENLERWDVMVGPVE